MLLTCYRIWIILSMLVTLRHCDFTSWLFCITMICGWIGKEFLFTSRYASERFLGGRFPSERFLGGRFPSGRFPSERFPSERFPSERFPSERFLSPYRRVVWRQSRDSISPKLEFTRVSRLCKQLQFQLTYLEKTIPFFCAPGTDPQQWTTQFNKG